MRIAVTGATGFLGRYIINHLLEAGHSIQAWRRPESDTTGFDENAPLDWVEGQLTDPSAGEMLVSGADALVHAALHHPEGGFVGGEGDLIDFVQTNVLGSLRLIEAARLAGVGRVVFISTCAVHDVILDDRDLDETHPLWPKSHYGAHKAAIEKFVHSYGLGMGYDICALRPTGIYGLAQPAARSKWMNLVRDVAQGKPIETAAGGKEAHAADVAQAVGKLLEAPAEAIRGQAFNCYDMYIAHQDVALIAREMLGSKSEITPTNKGPKHQIRTDKLRDLGVSFGGRPLLEETVAQLVEAARTSKATAR